MSCICGKTENLLSCSKCRSINYCSLDCQKQDWKNHKKFCSVASQITKPKNNYSITVKDMRRAIKESS